MNPRSLGSVSAGLHPRVATQKIVLTNLDTRMYARGSRSAQLPRRRTRASSAIVEARGSWYGLPSSHSAKEPQESLLGGRLPWCGCHVARLSTNPAAAEYKAREILIDI